MTDAPVPDETVATIDRLAAAAQTDPEGQPALWRAAFGLDQWWFIPNDLGPNGQPGDNLGPQVALIDDKPFLMAFTTPQRATQLAADTGLLAEGEEGYAIAMPPESFLEVADDFHQQGVFGINFDHGTTGFFAPLENLRGIWEHLQQNPA